MTAPRIASCILGFPAATPNGTPAQEASAAFWTRMFEEVASEGFDLVEVSDAWLKPALLSAARRAELRAAAAAAGLSIPSIHVQRQSVIDPALGEQHLAYHHASIDAAVELGAEVYSTGLHQPFSEAQRRALWFWTAPGWRDPDDAATRALAVRRLRELGEHAASVGLTMALEMYEDTYLGTAESSVRLVEEIGLGNVGLNPDVGNLVRLHRRIDDWRELYQAVLPYAKYWHLKNYSRDESADGGWQTAVPSTLRDGVIDYRSVLRMAAEAGYDGIFTCEHYGGDSIGVCGENRRYLAGLVERAASPVPAA